MAGVENRHRAHGGTDGETVEQAKERAPMLLRTRSRAVTAEDYEILAGRPPRRWPGSAA